MPKTDANSMQLDDQDQRLSPALSATVQYVEEPLPKVIAVAAAQDVWSSRGPKTILGCFS